MKKLIAATALGLTLCVGGIAMANSGDHAGRHAEFVKEKLAGIPAERQVLIQKTLDEGREARKASWQDMKTLREQQKALLTAPTFDKKAYMAKSQEIQSKRATLEANRTERFADLASKLSPDERQKVAGLFGGHRGGMHKHDKPAS